MSSVPPILGTAEIALNVKDISAMQTFYESTLGFKTHSQASMESETVDPSGEPTIVFMTICELDTALGRNGHPQMLVLIDFQRHVFAKKRFTGHHLATSTLNHLAFEIPLSSYEAHKQHLESKGLSPMEPPSRQSSRVHCFLETLKATRWNLFATIQQSDKCDSSKTTRLPSP